MYYRRKILLALMELIGKELAPIQFQKYLFLFTQLQKEKAYDFVPYYYGCFSFQANQDLITLTKLGYLNLVDDGVNKKYGIRESGNYLMMLAEPDRQNMLRIKNEFGNMSQAELIRYTYINYPYYAIKSVIAKGLINEDEMSAIERQKRHFNEPYLFTIGYEGRSLEKYINILIINDVHVLCDVRRNAFSQKYGFSKSQLEKACTGVGIKYVHIPQLGIESKYRQNLRTQEDYDALFDLYERTTLKENQDYVFRINEIINKEHRVALTCFEADPKQCHRTRVANNLMRLPKINYKLKHL